MRGFLLAVLFALTLGAAEAKEFPYQLSCKGEEGVSFLVHLDKEKAVLNILHSDGDKDTIPLVRADSKFIVAKHEDGFYLVFRNDGAWIITVDGKSALSGGACSSISTL